MEHFASMTYFESRFPTNTSRRRLIALRWLTTGSTRDLERDSCAEVFCFFALGFAEEIVVLEAHPVFRFVSEVASEFQAVLRVSSRRLARMSLRNCGLMWISAPRFA